MVRKKGLSSIIASVLIILLVIIAVGILWGVLKPSIIKSAESANLDCIKVDLSIEPVSSNCTAGKFKVTSNVGDITKLRFVFESATESKINDTVVDIPQMAAKVVSFSSNSMIANMTRVKIAAILTSDSGEEKVCEMPAIAAC